MIPIRQEFQVKLVNAEFLTGVELENIKEVQDFLAGVAEDLFVEQYFWQVPVELLRLIALGASEAIGATHLGGFSNVENSTEQLA